MFMNMDDLEMPTEWGGNPIAADELKPVDNAFELINAKALIRKMRAVCEEALKLPTLAITASDPLYGTDETRRQKSEIENKLHRVIAEAAEFSK